MEKLSLEDSVCVFYLLNIIFIRINRRRWFDQIYVYWITLNNKNVLGLLKFFFFIFSVEFFSVEFLQVLSLKFFLSLSSVFWYLSTFVFFQESVDVFQTELRMCNIRVTFMSFVGFKIVLMNIQVFSYEKLKIFLRKFLISENINRINS